MSPKRSAWSRSTKPCLNSSSTARKRTITSSRSAEVGGQAAERDLPDPGQLVDQLGDRLGDREPHRVDVEQVDERLRTRRERPDRGALQTAHAGALEQVGDQAGEALVGPDQAREREIGVVGEPAEDLGDVLERLALDQPRQQQVALFPQRELVVEVDVVGAGQQAARS